MDYAISVLLEQKNNIIENLKNGNKSESNLYKIKQIDKAVSWLKVVQKYSLDSSKWYNIFEFPEPENDYFSEYRITDDDNNEIEVNGNLITAGMGDLLITKKIK